MKTRTKVAVSLLVVLAIGISYVAAQNPVSSDAPCTAQKTAASCSASGSACAASAAVAAECPFKTAGIELTVAQQAKIQAIVAKARQDVLAALTVDQRAKFAPMSISFAMAKLATTPVTTAALTGAATTDACCASKASPTAAIAAKLAAAVAAPADATAPAKKGCGADCAEACCAKKACGANCTKACCAK